MTEPSAGENSPRDSAYPSPAVDPYDGVDPYIGGIDPYAPPSQTPVVYPPISTTPIPQPPPAATFGGYGQPVYGYVQPVIDLNAPYGYDASGQPLSSKSKVTAGLLQLILSFCFTLGGIGRLYAGQTSLGVIQLACSVIAWVCVVCGWALAFIPYFLWFVIWLWFVVDGIVLLAGRPVDEKGRLLRS